MSRELLVELERAVDHVVIRFGGHLSVRPAPEVRRAILRWLLERGRVVRDVTRLRLANLLHFYPATAVGVRHLEGRPRRVRRNRSVGRDSAASGVARRFLVETAGDWGLSSDLTEIAQLVVSELVSNAVEHAATASTVSLELSDRVLRIGVRDGSTIQPVARPLDLVSFRGRGLPLIAQVSKDWGIVNHSDGKTVWAVLALPAETTPREDPAH